MDPRIRLATVTDLKFIRDVSQRFTSQIGFIPKAAIEREVARGFFAIGELAGDEAGFLYTRPSHRGQPTTALLIQAAVRMDAQRQAVGLALVKSVAMAATLRGQHILQCWCRHDIDANLFWKAAGFTAIATRPGGPGHNKRHILWRLPLVEHANLLELPNETGPYIMRGHFVRASDYEPPTLIERLPAAVRGRVERSAGFAGSDEAAAAAGV